MKRLFLLIATLLLATGLAACGTTQNDNDDTNADQTEQEIADTEDQDNNADEQTDKGDNTGNTANDNDADATSNDEMKEKMDKLDYSEIEIEIDYGKDKEYEAEIEQDNGIIEADLEDELNGIDVKGEEAFNKIYPHVEKLTIDRDTKKRDAIDDVLKAFDLDPDYQEFEVKITFPDGTKVEFEDKK